jgi:DNA-binding NarL/FixJ family response regulator
VVVHREAEQDHEQEQRQPGGDRLALERQGQQPVVRFRDEMRRELRKLGARAEVRGPATAEDAGMASLTKRELEIAELITDRLTNPQIAGKLFLSKKTVESHVRNLFVKLGASSRVEVARIVERDRRERAGITGAP